MSRSIIYHGKKIQLALDTSVLEDGSPFEREVVLHPGAVVILPVLDGERICLLRNHRPSVGRTLLELPAGTLDPPEPPEEAAVRELAEETGYRAGRWRKLTEFFPSPGVMSERMYLFLAQDLTPGPIELQPGERIEPEVVAWPVARAWALDGTIQDAKTLVGLLLWEHLRVGEW